MILEDLAESYGSTLTITSAYRSPAYNKKVGGAKKSVHQQGLACDVLMNNTTKEQRLDFIRKAKQNPFIKGLGLYFSSSSGANFIHCDLGNTRQWERILVLENLNTDGRNQHSKHLVGLYK